MGRIPESVIQEIRDRVDIVGMIGRYVDLKPAGRNWKGLCPFHEERTPSFNVNIDRQIFHCFGCGEGGNAISFLVKHENLTFPEAVHTLAAEVGVHVPDTGRRENDDTDRLYAALEVAQSCYLEQLRLPAGKSAMEYLHRRGLDSESIESFGLGYAPDAWDTLVKALDRAKINLEAAASAGLLSKASSGRYFDRLRGRVTFPIQDVRGRVVGFGGRALLPEEEPKYLNTSESPIYQKRRVFYGYPQALEPIRRAGRVIVCEGYFDAIALVRAGLGESVATCGTALTPDHARDLKRRTRQVQLLFDGDEAGQKAMERALEILLPAGLRVRAIVLPEGCDPDDYLTDRGAAALKDLVDAGRDAIDIVIQRAMRSGGSTPGDKADAVGHVARLVAAIEDPVERSEYTRRLAMGTDTDATAVESVIRDQRRGGANTRDLGDSQSPEKLQSRRTSPEDRHLRMIGSILSQNPQFSTKSVISDMQRVLPDGPLKALILELADAGSRGVIDERGAVDFDAMEQKLTADQIVQFREVIVENSIFSADVPLDTVLEQLLDRYREKELEARKQKLEQKFVEPDADQSQLIIELDQIIAARQRLMERKAANRERINLPP